MVFVLKVTSPTRVARSVYKIILFIMNSINPNQITEDALPGNATHVDQADSPTVAEPSQLKPFHRGGRQTPQTNASDPRRSEGVREEDDASASAHEESFEAQLGWQCFRHVPYLTEEAKANLRLYKYAGADHGLAYRYFYNPAARWLVERIPEWIAPNLITLAGFFFSAVPFVLIFVVFGTHFFNEEPDKAKIPSWVFLAEAVCYFLYRMLDEMDGKQARRTGNASPLGLIFDHGCDAFAVGL